MRESRKLEVQDYLVTCLSKVYFDFPRKQAKSMVTTHWSLIESMYDAGDDDQVKVCTAIVSAEARKRNDQVLSN